MIVLRDGGRARPRRGKRSLFPLCFCGETPEGAIRRRCRAAKKSSAYHQNIIGGKASQSHLSLMLLLLGAEERKRGKSEDDPAPAFAP